MRYKKIMAESRRLLPSYSISVILVAVATLHQLTPTTAFLFPDLKFRTGGSGAPKYRIAVLQEAPYLYANGSGYMAQVMRRVSEAFRAQNDDAGIAFDIVPVHTWQQLVARARTSRWQLSLGLVIPSLELTRWRTRQPHTSIPVVYTTLKMVVRRRTRHAADDVSDDNVTSEWHHVNRRRHPSLNSRAKVLVVRGSPVHYLLVRANKYTGRVGLVNNVDDAVKRLQSAAGSRHGDADDDDDDDDVVLLTDAAVADHIAHHHGDELEALCPEHLAGSGWLYYGFFGRDTAMLDKLNAVLSSLMTDNSLLSLYTRLLSADTHQCPW